MGINGMRVEGIEGMEMGMGSLGTDKMRCEWEISKINDVTYIIMPEIAQESSIYLFPLWSFHNKIADQYL